jgi:hypothetical protein
MVIKVETSRAVIKIQKPLDTAIFIAIMRGMDQRRVLGVS